MGIFQDIEAFFLNELKAIAKTEVLAIANTLTTNKAALVAEAAASGQTAVAFVTSKLNGLVIKSPFLQFVAATFTPALEAELTALEGQGSTEVGPLIDEVVVWLNKEASYL